VSEGKTEIDEEDGDCLGRDFKCQKSAVRHILFHRFSRNC